MIYLVDLLWKKNAKRFKKNCHTFPFLNKDSASKFLLWAIEHNLAVFYHFEGIEIEDVPDLEVTAEDNEDLFLEHQHNGFLRGDYQDIGFQYIT